MHSGIQTSGQDIYCGDCGQKVSKDGALKLNFCPRCGNPLNINASVKLEKFINHEKTVILYELLDEIEEGKDPKQTIEQFVKDLNPEE